MCEELVVHGMDNSSLTKEKIVQLIKNQDASLTFVKLKKSSSSVQKFKMNEDDIVFCEDDQENDEVDCF